MKIKQLPLTLLSGILFTIATGSAFAENVALGQLQDLVNTTPTATEIKLAPPPGGNINTKVNLALDTKQVASPVGTVKAGTPPPPAPNPVKEFISENKVNIFGAGLGAYLGFALFGPIGILLGALFMLSFIKLSDA